MANINKVLLGVFSAAKGKIIGKIRTQKVFYLLEQMGLNSGLRFSYHNFGPYSDQLSNQIRVLEMFDSRFKESEVSNGYGGKFSVLTLELDDDETIEKVGDLDFDFVSTSVETMKTFSSKEIEIAATIHWLKNQESIADWKTELKRRKTSKADDPTIRKAEQLLAELRIT